jgi:hypothetical protein
LSAVGVASVMVFVGREFFRVMSPIVSIVSSQVILINENRPGFPGLLVVQAIEIV